MSVISNIFLNQSQTDIRQISQLNQTQVDSGSFATSPEELSIVMSKIFTEESRRIGHSFQPKASDVIVGTYAKCGTTWVQQITHGLRTRGSMDFDDITSMTPWITVAHDLGWDLDASQVAEPRLFKSHLSWNAVPKGCKYICSFRNPTDAFTSFYRFFEGLYFEPGSISMEALFNWRWPRDRVAEIGYWQHLSSWWEQRHNSNVLLLCYEDMKDDLKGTIEKIASFMEIDLDDELLNIVFKQSSREFMLAHKDQFKLPQVWREFGHKAAGLPYESMSHKITSGTSNNLRYQFSAELKQDFKDIWKEQIEVKFGFKDYQELRLELKEIS